MANSFSFNGTDFSTHGLIVTNVDKTLVPSPRFEQITTPYNDGALLSDTYFDPREISLDCTVIAVSDAALRTALAAIEKALTQRVDAQLILDGDTTKFYTARVNSSVRARQKGRSTAGMSIDFICKDPFAHSTTLTSDENAIDASPKSFSIINAGDAVAFPTFLLTADAAVSSLVLEHLDREEKITWGGTMATGDVLKIECDPAAWKISKALAADPTEFNRSTENVSGFFPLMDAGTNYMKIHNFSGASTTTHRARFKT